MEINFRIAVKAFIVDNLNNILLIKRRSNDVHKPGVWDIPGGRLQLGEDPYSGLKREAKEEVNLNIDIIAPLHVQHFTRDDGQNITMLIFLCKTLDNEIKLSEEHTNFNWTKINDNLIPDWLKKPCENFQKYFIKN